MRIFVMGVSLLLALSVQAQPTSSLTRELAPAQQSLARLDYQTAHREYSRFARSNPLAQFTLGMFEREGWGRPVNAVAACGWFEKAAARNIPAAQQFFGDCLAQGTGRPVDGPAAVYWYRKAGAAGIAPALCSAGDLMISGERVPQDVQQGLALCTSAAQAESPRAMLHLGDLYSNGGAVPADLPLARYWYDQAAQRHDHEAQFRLGIMLSEGQGGDAEPLKARFWLEHAAMEGYAPAYLPTAILYANAAPDAATGALTPQDLAKVHMWNSAARASASNPAQLAEIDRIDQLVATVMPPQWRPELDRQVAAHLAKFSPAAAAAAAGPAPQSPPGLTR
ncbi:MAG: tetratricopeptide repeat protein [Duganella sp.]